ncbi:DEAD/DEAH box helicase [Clostridium ihumii]|uniref:DEAD/DEAH box helicase n=1 Tax=Clostridium ihumii TaxID=1470356 RepID=UPI000550B6FC|nr:DEAD/DEAH box helicase [Clostridium ihumii]
MEDNFKSLNIDENIINALTLQGIKEPTPIQSKAIPVCLENKDVVAESETGSGKTLAYVLPIFKKVEASKRENQVIILTPTHELAVQVHKVIDKLSKDSNMGITSMTIIGNVNIKRQVEKLKEKPHIIIGSSGRILELIKMKKIAAHTVKTIIIDECDKLLDENNEKMTKAVIKTTLRERQVLCFSATVTDEVLKFSKENMKEPVVLKEEQKPIANKNIEHMYFVCERRDKILMIRKLIASLKPKKAIVFINNSNGINVIADKLRYHGIKAEGISGENFKAERKKSMDAFIQGKSNVLVSSDLTSRGLDIRGVTHIINLDIPENEMDYIHRAGRCGRGQNRGVCASIITENEKPMITKIKNKFSIDIDLKELYFGNVVNEEQKKSISEIVDIPKKKKVKKQNKNNEKITNNKNTYEKSKYWNKKK